MKEESLHELKESFSVGFVVSTLREETNLVKPSSVFASKGLIWLRVGEIGASGELAMTLNALPELERETELGSCGLLKGIA